MSSSASARLTRKAIQVRRATQLPADDQRILASKPSNSSASPKRAPLAHAPHTYRAKKNREAYEALAGGDGGNRKRTDRARGRAPQEQTLAGEPEGINSAPSFQIQCAMTAKQDRPTKA